MPPGPFRVCWHFYPRSPCGERPTRQCCAVGPVTISIHALLAESDRQRRNTGGTAPPYFYPRSPCGERRPVWSGITVILSFYPRSPCGERRPPYCTDTTSTDFYPRSPCGERRIACPVPRRGRVISIHALLAESDVALHDRVKHLLISIHALLAESDVNGQRCNPACVISIHALLAESDRLIQTRSAPVYHFYPRSPCGERRLWIMLYSCPGNFYPRSPCGERPMGLDGRFKL